MLGNLLGGFIVIVVGVNLVPTVADQVVAAQGGNLSGAADTILGLVPLFFVLGILSAGISIAAVGLRQSGLLGL